MIDIYVIKFIRYIPLVVFLMLVAFFFTSSIVLTDSNSQSSPSDAAVMNLLRDNHIPEKWNEEDNEVMHLTEFNPSNLIVNGADHSFLLDNVQLSTDVVGTESSRIFVIYYL